MIENAFSVPMLLDNYPISQQQVDLLKSIAQHNLQPHALEVGNAFSTAGNTREIHKLEQFAELCAYVTQCADQLWLAYGLSNRYEPVICETWINKHGYGGSTSPHIHSGSQLSAAYYFEFESGNGNIKFTNPLEYHQCHEVRETDNDIIVEVEQFDLVMFPGILRHSTEENSLHSERYVLTFNFSHQDRKPVSYTLEN